MTDHKICFICESYVEVKEYIDDDTGLYVLACDSCIKKFTGENLNGKHQRA